MMNDVVFFGFGVGYMRFCVGFLPAYWHLKGEAQFPKHQVPKKFRGKSAATWCNLVKTLNFEPLRASRIFQLPLLPGGFGKKPAKSTGSWKVQLMTHEPRLNGPAPVKGKKHSEKSG